MSDRRYRMDPEERPGAVSPLAELVDSTVRRVSTSLVIAGGLIALGLYAGGGTRIEAPTYQITASSDGHTVYRLRTDNGSIVACRSDQCWVMQRGNADLEEEPPAGPPAAQPAAPGAPAQLPAPSATPTQAPAPAPAPAPANR